MAWRANEPLGLYTEAALRLMVCGAMTFAAWRWLDLTVAVLTAPLWGMLLARPILDIAIDVHRRLREAALPGDGGSHHAVGGVSLEVIEEGPFAWIAATGLKRSLGHRETDDVFAARFPGGWIRREPRARLYIRADAVIRHLDDAPDRMHPGRLRLRRAVEQDILFPLAERRRRA